MKNLFFDILCVVSMIFLVRFVEGDGIPSVHKIPLVPRRQHKPNHDSDKNTTLYRIEYEDSREVCTNLEILFDESKKATKQIRYELYLDGRSTKLGECKSMNIGEEILKEDYVKACYDKNNLKTKLSNTPFSPFPILDGDDDKDLDLLVPQPLASQQDFNDESSALLACTYLVTAPMWKSVAEDAWKRVKEYVRLVAAVTKKKMIIITGTHGVVKYHKASAKNGHDTLKELFLTNDDRVPVPKAFWTLVIKKLPAYGDVDPETSYEIILVVENRNNHLEENKEPICKTIKCEDVGWNGVNKNIIDAKTYCCNFNRENLDKLDINIESELKFPIFNLKLKIFPDGRDSTGSIISKNVVAMILAEELKEDEVSVLQPSSDGV